MEEEDDAGKHLEMYLDPAVSEAFLSTKAAGDTFSGADRVPVLNVYTSVKTAVIKRSTDLLTKDEIWGLTKEVNAAILEELTTWVATVRGAYGTAEAGARTPYVQYGGPWGQAALRLRYVPDAGGWYA